MAEQVPWASAKAQIDRRHFDSWMLIAEIYLAIPATAAFTVAIALGCIARPDWVLVLSFAFTLCLAGHAFFVHYQLVRKIPHFFCAQPGCGGKHADLDKPWVCPRCPGHANTPVNDYVGSFLRSCPKCEQVPGGLRCPHCGKAFFLEQDKDESHWAKIEGGVSTAVEPSIDPVVTRMLADIEKLKAGVHRVKRDDLTDRMKRPLVRLVNIKKAIEEIKRHPEFQELSEPEKETILKEAMEQADPNEFRDDEE